MRKQAVVQSLMMICILFGFGCSKKGTTEPDTPTNIITNNYDVMLNGRIVPATGFGMGVDDSKHLSNWVRQDSASIGLHYPGDLEWGAVFITVGGDPKSSQRPWVDVSQCTRLSIEMKGASGGEGVQIGMKDRNDPDDGTETKKTITLTQNWKAYELMLSDFATCDLRSVYVVTEFVFPDGTSNRAVTVDVRKISILKE